MVHVNLFVSSTFSHKVTQAHVNYLYIYLLFFSYEKRKPTLTTLSGKTTPSVIKFNG